MEHEDWGPVLADIERRHHGNQEAVAKALSVATIGDDKDWRQHMSHALRFIDEMNRTMPQCSFSSGIRT